MHINEKPSYKAGGGGTIANECLKLKINETSKHGLKAKAKRVNYIDPVFNPLNKCDVSNGNWTEGSAIGSEIIRISINTLLHSFGNRRTKSAAIFIWSSSWLLRSGNKKACISHFLLKTEIMQYRVKMVRFKRKWHNLWREWSDLQQIDLDQK